MINLKIKELSPFGKNVFTLTLGTTIAQALPFLFYPIFARIYSPEEFGFFYGIISFIPILTILSTGMFEHAILIADSDRESNDIIKLILIRSLVILSLLLILFYSIFVFTNLFDNFNAYYNSILIIVPITFFTIVYNVFNEWSVRFKLFNNLGLNKIYNSSFTSISKLLSKYFFLLNNGLIVGELIGKFITSLICVITFIKLNRSPFQSFNFQNLKILYKKHNTFPKFMLPDQLINTIGGSVHVYIVGLYFSSSELGFLSMALSLLTVPVTVISSAIKDVFRQKANELYVSTGSCRNLYVSLFKPILFFGFFLFTCLYFIVPYAFKLFLGENWLIAGEYAQFLMPLFFFNFVSMSLGGVLVIANQIRISLYWQIYNLVTAVLALLVGSIYFEDIIYTLIFFMIAKSSSYLIYILLSFYYSKGKVEN